MLSMTVVGALALKIIEIAFLYILTDATKFFVQNAHITLFKFELLWILYFFIIKFWE